MIEAKNKVVSLVERGVHTLQGMFRFLSTPVDIDPIYTLEDAERVLRITTTGCVTPEDRTRYIGVEAAWAGSSAALSIPSIGDLRMMMSDSEYMNGSTSQRRYLEELPRDELDRRIRQDAFDQAHRNNLITLGELTPN